jgi:A/G-specific adenine glycosylase
MLGGMAALPGLDWGSEPPAKPSIASVHHGFTHFTLDLHLAIRNEPTGEGWWQPLAMLHQAGLPTLYVKAAEVMLARKEGLAA